jgi:hypothetical protein
LTEFTAHPSKWRTAALFLLGVGMTALSAWVATSETVSAGVVARAFGWFGLVFFGLCTLFFVKLFFDTDLHVRIDGKGIYWKRWSADTVPWAEIADVSVWEMSGQRSIILHLHDAAKFPSTSMMGKLAGANRALTGGDIAITLSGTDGNFDDAMAVIAHWMRQSHR